MNKSHQHHSYNDPKQRIIHPRKQQVKSKTKNSNHNDNETEKTMITDTQAQNRPTPKKSASPKDINRITEQNAQEKAQKTS